MIGERIKNLLKARHLKQKQLAIGAGVSEATMSDILKSKHDPGVHTIRRIAEYLDVDLNWLITGKYLEERRAETNQSVKISGKDIHTEHIHIIGNGNILYERRADYKPEKMAEIIEKCLSLSPASRDAVIKIIEVYLDIDEKSEKKKK